MSRSASGRARGSRPKTRAPRNNRRVLAGAGLVAAVAVAVLGWSLLGGQPGASAGPDTGTAPANVPGTVIQGNGGHWTNISSNTLAGMLGHKNFVLLNVKTPYIGEIDRTDLYIPYDQLRARAAQLPADRSAEIVVYCRTGSESAIASQTLIDLGYTNIFNLDGGMTAWAASGRPIVQRNRS